MFVLGVLASASTIVAKRPDAQAAIDKLVLYQGWIGFVCAIWGVWIVISALLNLGWLGYGRLIIWWITYFATGVLEFTLGLLLGYALLTEFLLSKNAKAMNGVYSQVRSMLVPYQTMLGFIAIAFGLWTVVASFMFTV